MSSVPESTGIGAVSAAMRQHCRELHASSAAGRYGVSEEEFESVLASIAAKYQPGASDGEMRKFLSSLRLEELALARGCMLGNEKAWEEFLTRFRASLYGAAYAIAKDDNLSRELADSLYADLYGMGADGHRRSKLAYYTGRGSLEGWLRTVLAQEYVNRYRSGKRTVSLDEKVEDGQQFGATPTASEAVADSRIGEATAVVLAELDSESRFLLASYFLDKRTLAEIGRMLRVHESTISRKLERLVTTVRKKIRVQLVASGMSSRQADEAMQDIDVRDLELDVREKLQQDSAGAAFYKKGKE